MATKTGTKGKPAKPWQVDPKSVQDHCDSGGFQNLEEKSTDPNAKGAARAFDKYSCPTHPTFFLVPALPVKMTADYRLVIRLGDYGICAGPLDIVKEGAATFLVCGLPLARKGDGMVHGGNILEGSETLIVGGPTFALPPNIKISGPYQYQNNVVRDLYYLSTTKNGREYLDRIDASGQPVTIEKANVGGSTATAVNDTDRQMGKPTGTVIKYDDKSEGFVTKGKNGEDVTIPPQVGLAHELGHATRNAEGSGSGDRSWQEAANTGYPLPKDQAAQRDASWAKIAKGKKGGPQKPVPSENDLRKELGLPERSTQSGKYNVDAPAPKNFRPGVCS